MDVGLIKRALAAARADLALAEERVGDLDGAGASYALGRAAELAVVTRCLLDRGPGPEDARGEAALRELLGKRAWGYGAVWRHRGEARTVARTASYCGDLLVWFEELGPDVDPVQASEMVAEDGWEPPSLPGEG